MFLFSYSPDQLEACRSVRVDGLNRELLKQGTLPVTRLSILFHCKWLLSHLLAPGPFVFSWPCPFMLLGQTCAANALCCFYSLIGASSCCLAEPRSTERALWHAGFTPTARSSVSTSPSVYFAYTFYMAIYVNFHCCSPLSASLPLSPPVKGIFERRLIFLSPVQGFFPVTLFLTSFLISPFLVCLFPRLSSFACGFVIPLCMFLLNLHCKRDMMAVASLFTFASLTDGRTVQQIRSLSRIYLQNPLTKLRYRANGGCVLGSSKCQVQAQQNGFFLLRRVE